MRALVTGATANVGRLVVDHLLRTHGVEVTWPSRMAPMGGRVTMTEGCRAEEAPCR